MSAAPGGRTLSLRARLVLAAAAAVAAAVALASVFVYFLVRNDLRAQVDRNLEAQADWVARSPFRILALPTEDPKVWRFHVRGLQFGEEGGYFHIVDSAGNVYEPDIYTRVPLPTTGRARAVAAGTEGSFFSDLHVDGHHVRVLARQLQSPLPQLGEPGFAIEALAQLGDTDKELAQIRLWLVLVSLGGIALASLAGFLVSRAALRPVRELSETAERVRTTRDLSQRITVDRSDELGRLAVTFNAMLESLDEAARRQQQLVQDASHELRTPLTSLRTNIEVLASHELPPGERSQLLDDVIAQLGELTDLVSELTVLARGEEPEEAPEEVRLDLLTEEAIRRTTRNHPEVPIDAQLAPSTIVGTPASVERAIANLLDNAAKWSPPGEAVDVRLADGELTVRDRGPGIGDDDLPHVFDRFYRATSARGMPGSGLGLAIVRQVAESHGGTIAVERPDDGGTLMRLRLGSRNGGAAGENGNRGHPAGG